MEKGRNMMRKRTILSCERGFSLIELLTVLLIVGILLGISVYYLKRYQRGKALDTAALQISSDLQWAQSRAMNTGSIHRVTFTQNSNQYEILNKGTNVTVERSLPGIVKLTSVQDSLRFLPQGRVEVDTVTVTTSVSSKKIILNSLGETTITY
jgi:prepilin-type N-terminal cleavage/methylation domain-containing protein